MPLPYPMPSKPKKVKKNPDYVFSCLKCQHNLFVDKRQVSKVLKKDCPECGEEPYENWVLIGEGDFDKLNR